MKCRHKLEDDGGLCLVCAQERNSTRWGSDSDADERRARGSVIPVASEPQRALVGSLLAEAGAESEQIVLLRSIESLLRRLVDKVGA